jgi:hypothetical protein
MKRRLVEATREEAFGVDLDYVLDFIEYCNKQKMAIFVRTSETAKKWIEETGADVDPDKLLRASKEFINEQRNDHLKWFSC